MASSPQLPGSHAWRDASGQPLPVEFFKFFRSLLTFIAETEGSTIDLAALTARVDALEAEGGSVGQLLGPNSVQVIGDLNTGDAIVKLQNDSGSPGNSYYYGTNAAGVKGFHEIPASDSAVPYFIPDGETFTVALNKQALFAIPIDLGVGSGLVVDGILVEVD